MITQTADQQQYHDAPKNIVERAFRRAFPGLVAEAKGRHSHPYSSTRDAAVGYYGAGPDYKPRHRAEGAAQ